MAAKAAAGASESRAHFGRDIGSDVRAGGQLTFYLDASALLPIVIEDAASVALDQFLSSGGREFFISDFAAAEVAAALSKLVRVGKLKRVDASDRLSDFDVWRVTATTTVDIVSADARLANAYVRRFELALRAPDALHAAIAHRLNATLITLDRRLANAACALGIAVEELTGE